MGRNELIPVPLPLKGLNTLGGLSLPWDSGYARELTNYVIYNSRAYVRPGVNAVNTNDGSLAGRTIHWFDPTVSVTAAYAILDNGNIRRISDGIGAATIGGSPAFNSTRCKHVSLDFVIGCREPRDVVAPFTAWTFTTGTITATNIRAACSHRGRLYVADTNTLEYSTPAAITGAMAGAYPLASLLDGQAISRIFSVSMDPSVTTENILVIFGDGGRVLIYTGDNPSSSTWYLQAKYDMATPISNVGFVEVAGDIFVATDRYAYWFRDLFNSGAQTAYENAPTRLIEDIWQKETWSGSVSDVKVSHAFYDPYFDAIVCQSTTGQFSSIANYGDNTTHFIYHRKYNAWSVWFCPPLYTPITVETVVVAAGKTRIAVGTGATVKLNGLLFGSIGETEDSVVTSWKTPYFPTVIGQKVNGVRVYFENTVGGYFYKSRSIFDYSDYNSVQGWFTQPSVTAVNPGNYADSTVTLGTNAWKQYQSLLGPSSQGGDFSLQFSQAPEFGSPGTQNQSVYRATLSVEKGGELF